MADNKSSSWVINEYTKSRLFIGGYDKKNQTLHLGWQVYLKEGWKTYWRSPGDAGLPPRWTWKNVTNIQGISVNWPTPKRLNIFDMDTFVYKHEVILPIEATVKPGQKTISMALDLEYMICEEICIPLEASYQIAVSSLPDLKISLFQKAQLDRFTEQVPRKISGGNIAVNPDNQIPKSLLIDLPDNLDHTKDIYIEGPENFIFKPVQKITDSQFRLSYEGPSSLSDQKLTLTIISEQGPAHEATITVR